MPQGEICVLRDESADTWSVTICRGVGDRQQLGRFDSREKAVEFAIAERDRRVQEGSVGPAIHMPDDCPCYGRPGGAGKA